MSIHPKSVSFKKLFLASNNNNSVKSVKIPVYQRPYRWGVGDKEFQNIGARITQLLEDSCGKDYDNEYFSGSIISIFRDGVHEIVDGQQRITTLFLLNVFYCLYLEMKLKEAIAMDIEDLKDAGINDEHAIQKIITKNFNSEHSRVIKLSQCLGNIINTDMRSIENHVVSIIVNEKSDKTVLSEVISNYDLRLVYSRDSYNEQLKKVLSGVTIDKTLSNKYKVIFSKNLIVNVDVVNYLDNYQRFGIESNKLSSSTIFENDSNTVIQYSSCLATIVRSLNSAESDFSVDMIENLLGYNDEAISFNDQNTINFCLIETYKQTIANALFESLNDRSLELDDIDLIKNKMLGKFYGGFPEGKNVDGLLNKLDEVWEKAFPAKQQSYIKTQLSTIAVQIITKDASVYKTGSKSREILKPIQKYLDSKLVYGFDNIEADFYIFKKVYEILNKELKIAGNSKYQKAIEDSKNNVDIFRMSAKVIDSFSRDGVLGALIYSKMNINEYELKKLSVRMWWINIIYTDATNQIKPISDNLITSDYYKGMESFPPPVKLKKDLKTALENIKYKSGTDNNRLGFLFVKLYLYASDISIKDDMVKVVESGSKQATKDKTIISDLETWHLDHLDPVNILNNNNDFHYINTPDSFLAL